MKTLLLSFFLSLPLWAGPYSVPTPPSLLEQYKESDFVIAAKITQVDKKVLKPGTTSVQCTLQVKKAYKAKYPLSPELEISFLIRPGTYGKLLSEPPEKGDYIIFLQNKMLKDASGKPLPTVVLYDPNPFAIKVFEESLEKQILNLVE